MSTEFDCSICLESLTAPRVTVQLNPCNHSNFCLSCIVQLCQDNSRGIVKCPLCRAPMAAFEFLDGSESYFEVRSSESPQLNQRQNVAQLRHETMLANRTRYHRSDAEYNMMHPRFGQNEARVDPSLGRNFLLFSSGWDHYRPNANPEAPREIFQSVNMTQASSQALILLEADFDLLTGRIKNWHIKNEAVAPPNGDHPLIVPSEDFFSGNPMGRFSIGKL